VRNQIEIFDDVDVYHPPQSLAHDGSMQRLQCLMSRAAGPESVWTWKEVLFVHCLQHHDGRSLRQFVLEGWHGHIELHFDPVSLWVRLR
jgi:hypothetical protein